MTVYRSEAHRKGEADYLKAPTDEGVGPSEITRRLGIGRTSVNRVLPRS
jgi:hypothetical protein